MLRTCQDHTPHHCSPADLPRSLTGASIIPAQFWSHLPCSGALYTPPVVNLCQWCSINSAPSAPQSLCTWRWRHRLQGLKGIYRRLWFTKACPCPDLPQIPPTKDCSVSKSSFKRPCCWGREGAQGFRQPFFFPASSPWPTPPFLSHVMLGRAAEPCTVQQSHYSAIKPFILRFPVRQKTTMTESAWNLCGN